MDRTPGISGIGFVDAFVSWLLKTFGTIALIAIMVPPVLVILVLSFLLSLGLATVLGFLLDLLAVPREASRMVEGAISIGGGLVLTFLGTVKLYRRLERVVNLLTGGEWKSDDEIRSATEQARRRSSRNARLTAAELTKLDKRLAQRKPNSASELDARLAPAEGHGPPPDTETG